MRTSRAKITSKGQITIPVEIRRALCAKPGDAVTFVLADDGSVRVECAVSWVERTAGMFAEHAISPPPSAGELRDMAMDAIAGEVMESMNRNAATS